MKKDPYNMNHRVGMKRSGCAPGMANGGLYDDAIGSNTFIGSNGIARRFDAMGKEIKSRPAVTAPQPLRRATQRPSVAAPQPTINDVYSGTSVDYDAAARRADYDNSIRAFANTDADFSLMANGGKVRGPGGPTDDKVGPVMLSSGEYVLPADTVDAVGIEHLDKLKKQTHEPVDLSGKGGNPMFRRRAMRMRQMADGGLLEDEEDQGAPSPGFAPPGLNALMTLRNRLTTGLGSVGAEVDNLLSPTSQTPARQPVAPTPQYQTSPRTRARNRGAGVNKAPAYATPQINDAPERVEGAYSEYIDRSGKTEGERQKLLGAVRSQLEGLGRLNMASKRNLAGRLLEQQGALLEGRQRQLADADRGLAGASDSNAGRRQSAAQITADLRDRFLNRRSEADIAARKLAAANDPNSLENQKTRLEIARMKTDEQRANELHDATIRDKTDAGLNARIDARIKSDGVTREQATAMELADQQRAGNDIRRSTVGRAADAALFEQLGTDINSGIKAPHDALSGRGFGVMDDASIPQEAMPNLRPEDFTITEAGGLNRIRAAFGRPRYFIDYNGESSNPELDKPHLLVDDDDPRLLALRRRQNTKSSGY